MNESQWNTLGADYSEYISTTDDIAYNAVVARMKQLGAGRILDYGCGPGRFYDNYIAQNRDDFSYVGYDLSAESIRIAQSCHPDVEFHDPSTFDETVDGFDIALLCYVLTTIKEQDGMEQVLNDVHDRLLPGGTLMVIDPSPYSTDRDYVSVDRRLKGLQREGQEIDARLVGMKTTFTDYWHSELLYDRVLRNTDFRNLEFSYPAVQDTQREWKEELRYPHGMVIQAKK